jgi:alpha-N-arabinofuranosidase
MGIKKGVGYDFSVMYRQQKPGVKLNVELVDTTGKILGSTSLALSGGTGIKWKKQAASFTATSTEAKAKLNIWFKGTGVIDLDMISLFPKDT